MRGLLIVFLLHLAVYSIAQVKYEREYTIDSKEVPTAALQYVEQYFTQNKVRWYQEVGLVDTTIEAKTKFNRRLHSIEFDKFGLLKDVEVTVKWKELPASDRAAMELALAERFGKYQVDKVQKQYSGDPDIVGSFLTGASAEMPTLKYEVIACSKVEGEYLFYELLYLPSGALIRESKIVRKNADNIEY